MSVIARDTYVDTPWKGLPDHSPTQGGPIVKHPTAGGNFYCIGNRALCRTPGVNYYAAEPATADYLVSADIILFSSIGSAGVVGRVNTGSATFYHAYINQGNDELVLAKWVNGAASNMESVFGMGFAASAAGVVYNLALDLDGTTIRVLIDGDEIISQTDASMTAITAKGRGGIRAGIISNVGTGKHIDNFLLTDASTAPVGRSFVPGPLGI